ncbi:MAG: metallophosphoesterase, partial [Clostridia bacterium]|nr:metallophosphoesterase [Clostridia bacterium]
MKTAVIISDSHGNMRGLNALDGVFAESDFIIHLGDTSSDGARIRSGYGNKTILINGNCDPVKTGEDEKVIEIEGVKIFATHGHLYSAKTTLQRLAARAKELGCGICLYGHTHRAREDDIEGVKLINPGTMSRYSQNSYCYLVINGEKAVTKIV